MASNVRRYILKLYFDWITGNNGVEGLEMVSANNGMLAEYFFSVVDHFTKNATIFTTESRTNLAAGSMNKVNNYLANMPIVNRDTLLTKWRMT